MNLCDLRKHLQEHFRDHQRLQIRVLKLEKELKSRLCNCGKTTPDAWEHEVRCTFREAIMRVNAAEAEMMVLIEDD